jgi:hypothetical protein
MAGLLWGLGLGWAGAPAGAGAALRDLLVGVPLGAACYAAVVGACWLLAGRPAATAEHDAMAALLRVLRRRGG